MPIVVGISLRTAGKIYFFNPGTERYHLAERILVETARGLEIGTVKLPPHEVPEDQLVTPLKSVLRRATALDIGRDALNREREEHALQICKRLVERLNLPMRLIDAQYTFDASNVLIHFLAENRVDFRELVRELARELHTRIELRQVGVRDEAKLIGGHGICGRRLCCASFLSDFTPVAISMAKEQGLALNPQKISGTCGRLMCCLAYEHDFYREMRGSLPRMNAQVETPQGIGKVVKVNALSQMIEVIFPETPGTRWFSVDEIGVRRADEPCCAGAAEHSCDVCPARENVIGTEGTTFNEPDVPASTRRRARRRKKTTLGAAPAVTAAADPTSVAPATETPEKNKRPRRRKPRLATDTAEQDAPVAVSESPATSSAPRPSGRYRPRRRPK